MHTQAQNFDKGFNQSFIEKLKSYNRGVIGYPFSNKLLLTDGAVAFFQNLNSFKIAEQIDAVLPVIAEVNKHFAVKYTLKGKGVVMLSVVISSKDIEKEISMANNVSNQDQIPRICLVRYKRIGFVISLPSEL